jgi:hypothetical protein
MQIDTLHTFTIKGSKYYRESLKELLGLDQSFMTLSEIVKMNLRSLLRREKTNKSMKTLCMIQIINMFRVQGDTEMNFYHKCVKDVSMEFKPK